MIEKLNYFKATRPLYKWITKRPKYLRKAKVRAFLKNGREAEYFADYKMDSNKLILPLDDPIQNDEQLTIDIANKPIIDDATHQHIYYWVEDQHKTHYPKDDFSTDNQTINRELFKQMFNLGLQEGKAEQIEIKTNKQMILIATIMMILLIALIWLSFTMTGQLSDIQAAIEAVK